MKVTVILIVTGALGTIAKELVHELEDLEIRRRVETWIQSQVKSYQRLKNGTWCYLSSHSALQCKDQR